MNSTIRKRNNGIDLLKLIAAFSVITLHISPKSPLGDNPLFWITNSARYAVPVFFIITGFFTGAKFSEKQADIFPQIRKLIWIFVWANIIYLPWLFLRNGLQGVIEVIDFTLITRGTSYHLWFIPSLIFGILALKISFRSLRPELVKTLAITFLVLYAVSNTLPYTSDHQIDFFRFLSSFSLLWVGYFIRQYDFFEKKSYLFLISLFCLGVTIQLLEVWAMSEWFSKPYNGYQFGFGTLIHTFALFLIFVKMGASPQFTSNGLISTLAEYGRKYSLGIYIFHVWAITLLKNIYEILDIDQTFIAIFMMPAIIFCFTLFFEYFRHKLIKQFFKKTQPSLS